VDELVKTPVEKPEGRESIIQRSKLAKAKLAEVANWKQTQSRRELIAEKEKERTAFKREHEQMDKNVKYFKYELPKKLLRRADLGVKDISFGVDNELYVADRRVDLLSETERALTVTKLALAIAKKKGVKTICLDGVEIMDKAHRDEWLGLIKNSGLKVLYTRQGKPEYEFETEVKRA